MNTTKRITNGWTLAVVAMTVLVGTSASALVETTTVLDDTATWNYFHPTDGTDPAVADADYDTTWYTQNDAGNSYDGPAFAGSGSGLFGYGAISYAAITEHIGTPPSGSRYTAYFVSTFDLGAISASTVTNITADILVDDGAFVYINGQFAGGQNIGGISDTYFALTGPSGNEGATSTITLDKALLIDGVNTIALSLHNTSSGSSDLGFTIISVDVESISSSPTVVLSGSQSLASTAPPGTLVGNLNMANAPGAFTYALESGGDNDNFAIASASTNLRTAAWMDASVNNISIVATETGGDNLVVTNSFEINITAPTHLLLKATATMDASPTASSQVGILGAQPNSGTSFEIVSGREDLFEIDTSGTKLMQVASTNPGSAGETHYLEIKAMNDDVSDDAYYLIEATVGTPSGTVLIVK